MKLFDLPRLVPALLIAAAFLAAAQTIDTKNWTAAEDHQNMMDQLGIKALRPGPERQRSGAQPRQLRRIAGQSLSESARRPDAEERQEGHYARNVVESAPARNRGRLRA